LRCTSPDLLIGEGLPGICFGSPRHLFRIAGGRFWPDSDDLAAAHGVGSLRRSRRRLCDYRAGPCPQYTFSRSITSRSLSRGSTLAASATLAPSAGPSTSATYRNSQRCFVGRLKANHRPAKPSPAARSWPENLGRRRRERCLLISREPQHRRGIFDGGEAISTSEKIWMAQAAQFLGSRH
jgi:hypothetical protein